MKNLKKNDIKAFFEIDLQLVYVWYDRLILNIIHIK